MESTRLWVVKYGQEKVLPGKSAGHYSEVPERQPHTMRALTLSGMLDADSNDIVAITDGDSILPTICAGHTDSVHYAAPPERNGHPFSQQESRMKKWQCVVCGFIYDEAAGWPDDGIAPGTRWDDVPAEWVCPDCGVGKEDFEMVEF
jgi:rubredoxin